MDKESLRERTIKRGLATWKPLDISTLAAGELAEQEGVVNVLGRDSIRQGITLIEGAADFEASMRDLLFELDLLELDQEQQIALNRFLTEKQALALRVSGQLLVLAAQEYDAQVQGIIMDAREYAAAIESEGVELQKQRALMDVKKGEAQLEETQSRIMLELVERRNQEIELAKAKVEVARANVRAILADVAAEEAGVRVVRAELEVAKAEADKAELIADVAMIMADIVVRGLARIKLAVDTAELEAAFTFIEQRLDDMMAIAEEKLDTAELQLSYEKLLNAEVAYYQEAEERHIDLEKARMAMMERIGQYERMKQALADQCSRTRKDVRQAKREALTQVKSNADVALMLANTWSDRFLNEATRLASKSQNIVEHHVRTYSQTISKGTVMPVGGPSGVGLLGDEFVGGAPSITIADASASDQNCNDQEHYP